MPEYLDPSFVAPYASRTVPWGFNGLGEVIFLRTYSRPVSEALRGYLEDPEWLAIEDSDRRRKERWHETITRTINGAQDIGADYTKDEMERLFDHMFHLRGSFSGRGLWQLGTPLVERLGGPSTINCWATAIEKVEDFEFLMDMSMVGGGVGYTIERSSIHELPKVKTGVRVWHENTNDADVIVPDKREGWSRLLHSVLKSYFYTGRSFSYSTILIRRYGSPLKAFGGTASGPEALIEGIADICRVLDARSGKKLRSVDVLDVCNIIGRLVVAGSARRSAQIALGDPDDYLFLGAKDWSTGSIPGWRENSNNSIIVDDWDHVVPKVWKGYDGSGEPYGFINRELLRSMGRLGEPKNDHKIIAVNPCVTADTWVLTDLGPRRVSELLERPFVALVDGKPYQATQFRETGKKGVLKVETFEGYLVRATEDHQILTPDGWISTGQLSLGDSVVLHDHLGSSWLGDGTEDEGYILGHLVGDGTFGAKTPMVAVWESDPGSDEPKNRLERIMAELPHRSDWGSWYRVSKTDQLRSNHVGLRDLAKRFGIVRGNKTITEEVEKASSAFYIGFLRGLFDTDGHVEGDSLRGGVSVRLSQSDEPMLRSAQRMLSRLGIRSCLRPMHVAGPKNLPGGVYETRASFRLIITGAQAARFMELVGFENRSKTRAWVDKTATMSRGFYDKPMTATVTAIVPDGVESVYDCTVEDVHAFDANGIYVHNCAEIGLEDGECCNLATVFLPNVESYEQFLDISKLLYKTQKAITRLDYPYEKTREVVRRNARLGLNPTGLLQASETQLSWLDPAYAELKKFDVEYSMSKGWNPSISLTTVQPGGTLPLLAGVTAGISPAEDQYFIRRVRFGSGDPLVEDLRRRGHKVQYDVGIDGKENHTRFVVDFYCESPKGAVLAKELSAVAHLEWQKRIQTIWADNAVSITVRYRPSELPEIKAWLAENYNTGVKSVSFLLLEDHNFPLAPLESTTEWEYREAVGKLNLDTQLSGGGDMLELDSCASGACPVR